LNVKSIYDPDFGYIQFVSNNGFYSFLYNATLTADFTFGFYIDNSTTSHFVDNIVLFALTDIFGAGNEPSVEYMDLIIEEYGYIDGTVTVPNPNDPSFYAFGLDRELKIYNDTGSFTCVNYYDNDVNDYIKLGDSIVTRYKTSATFFGRIFNMLRVVANIFTLGLLDDDYAPDGSNPLDAEYIYMHDDMTWWEKLMWSLGQAVYVNNGGS
jgi:hypothetical protein